MDHDPPRVAVAKAKAMIETLKSVQAHKDIEPPNPRISDMIKSIRSDASNHLSSAVERAISGQWDDAEIETEIALDRLRLASELQMERELHQ